MLAALGFTTLGLSVVHRPERWDRRARRLGRPSTPNALATIRAFGLVFVAGVVVWSVSAAARLAAQ
jgi:hypothetical protein